MFSSGATNVDEEINRGHSTTSDNPCLSSAASTSAASVNQQIMSRDVSRYGSVYYALNAINAPSSGTSGQFGQGFSSCIPSTPSAYSATTATSQSASGIVWMPPIHPSLNGGSRSTLQQRPVAPLLVAPLSMTVRI
jgi:hypothetical protein